MKKNTLRSWTKYGNDSALERLSKELTDFLSQNKTEREIVRHGVEYLKKFGAKPINECEKVIPGDVVYLNWKNRSLAVARIGTDSLEKGLNAIISHGDAPRIDVKERPLYEQDNVALFDCHYYGGIKKYQWVNVPLALHGEIYDGQGKASPIVVGENDVDPIFTIPDLAVHVDSDMEKRTAKESVDGENLDAIVGSLVEEPDKTQGDDSLKRLRDQLEKYWKLNDTSFASADLTFVPAGRARELGFDRSMIAAYALDDHICTSASWSAFWDCSDIPQRTVLHMVMDKEEIGSTGVAGADGALFESFVAELLRLQKLPCDSLTLRRAISASLVISADVTVGANPLYESSYVRDQQPLCGNGVVITKSSGSRGKYDGSEARGEMMAAVIALLDDNEIPWQVGSFGRIDKAGGGTLAKFIARLGADVIDIGPALLSMHSPLEIGSKADYVALQRCYKAFFYGMKALA